MPARPANRNSWMRSCSHSRWRLWMAWVLCLCAWRGPLPVVHCHAVEALGQSESEPDWHLVEHLSVCHAEQHDADEMGWHVHFVLPLRGGGSKVPHPLPSDRPALAELITHDSQGRMDAPVSNKAIDALADFVAPVYQPTFVPTAPKLIPLAPPRIRPSRVSPRIYFCVAQC